MTSMPAQLDRNPSAAPHSFVYKVIVLLAAGFVLAAWGFSAGPGYMQLVVPTDYAIRT